MTTKKVIPPVKPAAIKSQNIAARSCAGAVSPGPADVSNRGGKHKADPEKGTALAFPAPMRMMVKQAHAHARRGGPSDAAGPWIHSFQIMHGTTDPLVNINQSRRLVERLNELGVKCRYVEMKGEGQGWFGTKLAEALDLATEFLREQIKP
jgi:acetyl esterase/lipase